MVEERKLLIKQLKGKIPTKLEDKIPHRWYRIGAITIVTIPDDLKTYKKILGQELLTLEKKWSRTILGKMGPTTGQYRIPSFEVLAGKPKTVTIHKELGTKFKIDVTKLTFSPGNHGERTRLTRIIPEGEFIIDMFCCIGNLSLPVAVNNNPKQVIGTEINPVAYEYLQENIRLNGLEDKMIALLGDNRRILGPYLGKADRVLMGFLEADEEQRRLGIKLCKEGGVIHYHEAVPSKEEIRLRPIKRLEQAAKMEDKKITVLNRRRVKKYSPGIEHIVVDVRIQ
jgi:tRNA wybutosine-synthesizing protein 2